MASAITPERIGELIDEAPAWAKQALTQRNDRLRADALVTLGHHVYHSLSRTIDVDRARLPLPL